MSEAQEFRNSRGVLLRRLDKLGKSLEKANENLTNPNYITLTRELEKLKDEARYCFVDAGPLAQRALQEVASMEFRGSASRKPRSKLEHARIMSGGVLALKKSNAKYLIECKTNVERMIERTREVRKILAHSVISETVQRPPKSAKMAAASFRDLQRLRDQKSVSHKQAAEAFGVSERTIRTWSKKGILTKTAKRRIVTNDDAFANQFNLTHSPPGA